MNIPEDDNVRWLAMQSPHRDMSLDEVILQKQQRLESDLRWLALLIRQACLLIAKGIERHYAIGGHKEGEK